MSRYVATDWHGIKDIADQILDYLKPEDELYFLGDAIDRGPDGLYIMNKLLKDPRVTYLLGSHEDLMLMCVPDFIEGHFEYAADWYQNGGEVTWKQMELSFTDTEKLWFCKQIRCMPRYVNITNTRGQHILLSHAGYDPWVTDKEALMWGIKDRYVWDRKHIHSSPEPFKQEKWKDTYVIHGHTTVLTKHFRGGEDATLPETKDIKAVHYADGHKICLDLCTAATGRAVLFDLDTFEEIYFRDITIEAVRQLENL